MLWSCWSTNELMFIRRFILKAVISFVLFIGLFLAKPQFANSSSPLDLNYRQGPIVEHLRLKVPKEYRRAWLIAEKQTWEPWLDKKKGFLGRKLFWDKNNEEATLLISWSSREQWKNIPQSEIEFVQKQFEEIARNEIGTEIENPFPLVFEGELLLQ